MKKNMGLIDRFFRIVLAIIVGILYSTKTINGTLGLVLMVVAVIFILTSLVSYCPLYSLFGIITCKIKK